MEFGEVAIYTIILNLIYWGLMLGADKYKKEIEIDHQNSKI